MFFLVVLTSVTFGGIISSNLIARIEILSKGVDFSKLTFLYVVLLSLGLLLILLNSISLEEAFKQKKWPKTLGTITSLDVSDKGSYRPVVNYKYNEGDKEFSGISDLNVPNFGSTSTVKEVAFKTIGEFEVGESVTVYYDPKNPANSMIKLGPTWDQFTRLALGIIFYWVGVVGIRLGFSKRAREGKL